MSCREVMGENWGCCISLYDFVVLFGEGILFFGGDDCFWLIVGEFFVFVLVVNN